MNPQRLIKDQAEIDKAGIEQKPKKRVTRDIGTLGAKL
jgi:hypothetical protein